MSKKEPFLHEEVDQLIIDTVESRIKTLILLKLHEVVDAFKEDTPEVALHVLKHYYPTPIEFIEHCLGKVLDDIKGLQENDSFTDEKMEQLEKKFKFIMDRLMKE